MKTKVLGLVLCLSLVITMLVGCATPSVTATPTTAPSSGGSSESSDENITLKWALWDYDTTPYWAALIEEYKKVKPNVTIEYTDLGSTDYMTVLAAELSGSGREFDVVTIKDASYATLVQKNTLEPLDSY